MADTTAKEEYTYQVDKIKFIVTPVYKEEGETMGDILLKLMLSELDSVSMLSSRLKRQYRAAVPNSFFLLDSFIISSFPAAKQEVLSYLYYTSSGRPC